MSHRSNWSQCVAFVCAVIMLVGSPAMALDQDDDAVAVARTLSQLCRGMPGDAEHHTEICEASYRALNVATRLGYCYGKKSQIGADYRWHKCTRDSLRPETTCKGPVMEADGNVLIVGRCWTSNREFKALIGRACALNDECTVVGDDAGSFGIKRISFVSGPKGTFRVSKGKTK